MTMRLAGLFLAFLLLGGCAAGPDYVRPELEADLPQQWVTPTLAESLESPDQDDHWRWWQAFGDNTLDGLVESALVHNNDLAAAAGRVLEARALAGGAESARWPAIEIGGSASRSKISSNQTFGMLNPYRNAFSASATLRYEVDLWGRLSRGKEAATATLLASEEDRRAVAQAVIAGVVRSWLQIQELQLQVALNERTVANFQKNQEFVRSRYERGLVTSLDVHLASQNLASAQAQGPALRQNLAQSKRQLEILVGRYPAGDIITGDHLPTALPDPLPAVPAGLPSELLERRPDLGAAEMRLRASVARIGEAKAALYPRISLTGSAGSSSAELSDLFTEPTNIWSLAGSLVMPLINRGATKAQIKAAEARAQQAVAGYRTAVLQAFAEVENALDQDFHQSAQEEFLKDSVLQARRAVARAEERYGQGLDNILVTLETQRRLYTAESNYLTTQRLRRTARVNLVQALGGPWEADENPHTAQNTQGANQ
jgi:multidrug efflux system outer membrane protein